MENEPNGQYTNVSASKVESFWNELSVSCPWRFNEEYGDPDNCTAESLLGEPALCCKEECAIYHFMKYS